MQVRADGLEVSFLPDTLLRTPVTREVMSVHLLAVVAGAEAGGVLGPAEGGGDKGEQKDGDEQQASQ